MDEEPVDEAPEVEESPQELPPAPERVEEVVEAPKPKFDLRAYGQRIHQLVLKHRRYPRSARRLGLEGKVFVKIAVGRNGELAREPEIYRSSGEAVLDKEALRMVRAATPLLPLPNEFEKESGKFSDSSSVSFTRLKRVSPLYRSTLNAISDKADPICAASSSVVQAGGKVYRTDPSGLNKTSLCAKQAARNFSPIPER